MDVERILAATEDIITPFAVVDEETVERNLARMAKLAADHNVTEKICHENTKTRNQISFSCFRGSYAVCR